MSLGLWVEVHTNMVEIMIVIIITDRTFEIVHCSISKTNVLRGSV